MWHLIGHKSEFEKHGDFVVIGGIAVTNFHGELVGWDGRCSHRGTYLYGDRWHGNDPTLKCAYHGRCQQAGMVRVRYEVRQTSDWVFVCHYPIDDAALEMPLIAPQEMQMPPMKLYKRTQYIYQCPWDVAVENALDFDHVKSVHGSSLHTMQLASVRLDMHDGGSTEFFESGLWQRLDDLDAVFPKPTVFEEDCGYDYVHMHVYPDSCLSSTRGWTWALQNYSRIDNNRTMFTHRMYVSEGREIIAESAWASNMKVFEEDAAIVRFVPSRYALTEPHEKRITHFRWGNTP